MARAPFDRGLVAPDLIMGDLYLVLRRAPEVQEVFDSFVTSQYDATSPNYHQWLDADQVGERFGPAPADVQTLTSWLTSRGFRVDEVSKDRVSIRFSGMAAQVQNAFHTEIHTLNVKGATHIANMSDLQIPAALAPVVAGVRGLNNFFPRPLHRLGRQVTRNGETGTWERRVAGAETVPSIATPSEQTTALGTGGKPKPLFGTTDAYQDVIEDVAPYDFATMYNVLPLWKASTTIDGTGQTIAIAGTSNISLADVAAFRTAFGLPTSAPANTPTVVITNSDPGACPNFDDSCSGDLVENSLDVEWSGAIAKGSQIVLVTSSAPTPTTDALYLSESYIVQNKTASIMNVSYGSCEILLGTAGNTQYNNLWQTAASEGISVMVATGDAGSPACDQGYDASQGVPYGAQFGLQVSGIASTPYNTAVGGTDFNWGSTAAPYWSATNNSTTAANALGYVPEIAWNSTCVNSLVWPALAADAALLGVAPVTDAESACNFIIENNSTIQSTYGVNLGYLVDTVGGGGGASNCIVGYGGYPQNCSQGYAKPSWQTGVTGIPADSARDIPDVSFFASNGFLGSSYLICVSAGGSPCTYSATSEPTALEVGGTSVASPAMAGVMALVNQRTGAAQGNPDITLYGLAVGQSYSSCSAETVTTSSNCLFNDINSGTIAMACVSGDYECTPANANDPAGILTGYSAGVGYDEATGLGSLNVANVVNHWPLASAPTVTLSPSSLTFPSTVEGSSSATQAVTLKNTGGSSLTISNIGFSGADPGSYSETSNCGTSVAAGASCTITVTFKPLIAGTVTAALSVSDNAFDSPQTVQLSGTGTVAQANAGFSATSITFGSTAVGATNATTLQLQNYGTTVLSISGISITGANASSFLQTNMCGASLAAGTSCSITLTFRPLVAGSLTASLQAVDNAYGSPQTVALSGTSTSGAGTTATLSPTSLSFPSTVVGVAAATQSVTLKNTGTATLSIASKGFSGANIGSFAETDTCGFSVAASASCTLTFTFTPAATGPLSATFSLTDNATGSPQTVSLSGTGASAGTGLTITPSSLSFASTPVGTAAAVQLITLNNNTSAAVSFTASTTITGPGASSFTKSASTCVNPLPAGASCTNSITFTPTVAGALTATVTYTDSASGTPQTVALTGTGASGATGLTITPSSLTFASTPVGTAAAVQVITLKNNTSSAVSFTASTTITGSGASSFTKSASTCTNPLPAGATCTNSITFKPTATGTLTATVTYTDSAATAPQTVALTGTGASAATGLTITPSSLNFASTPVGTAAAVQVITLKNNTSSAVSFTASTTITGPGASSFTKSASTCTNPLPAGASCTNSITFTPTATGTLSATVTYTDSASSAPQTVALTGAGASGSSGLTITPSSVTFASTPVGTSTAAQVITLKNNTSSAVTFTATTTITGPGASSFAKSASTCANPLAAGASCTNSITFTPSVAGALAATITYTDSASSTPQTVALTGTGH